MGDRVERLYERLLVVRCQTGDEAAFAELVALYAPRLGYYLKKLLGDPSGAEDLLQDVWLDVFRHVPRLREPAAFPAWLYRIARDRAYRALRKRRPPAVPLKEEELPGEVNDNGADFTAADAAAVHAALDELPPEQREALVLRFLEDMTYEEIARVTGCELGTVRSRLYYGKRALRRVLEKEHRHE
jgi:RNA polymerase sigma-70 factor (ECF subfamily)